MKWVCSGNPKENERDCNARQDRRERCVRHHEDRREHDAAVGDGGTRLRDPGQLHFGPGLIETNQTRELLKDPQCAAAMFGKVPLGPFDRTAKVTNLALSLAPDQSSCVMGIDVVIEGGIKVW